jgi:hypothetical protein
MTVFITLTTAGTDSGPFNLYSDLDGFVTPFEVGVSKMDLQAGYSSGVVPDFTSVIRVLSTAQYCVNYVDIILTEPTTTTTTTTECQRPEGLLTKNFNWQYIPDGGPTFFFTGSLVDACLASTEYNTNIPSGIMVSKPGQLASFTIGETVYLDVATDCTLIEDGFYITDLVTQEVTEIVDGIIISIGNCPTTTTTTTAL